MRETVVQRKDDEHDGFLLDADHRAALFHVGRIVPVGEEDALGIRRGAGCVRNVGIVVRADAAETGFEFDPVGVEEFVSHLLDFAHPDFLGFQLLIVKSRVVKDNNLLYVGTLRKDGADLGQMVSGHQDPLGIRMVDTEHQVFPFSQVHGKGNVRSACIHGTQLR